MRWGSVIAALGICFLAACSFESRSNGFTCETSADCPNARACEMGWCVVSDPTAPDAEIGGIDADTTGIDAAPDAMPDAMPVDECVLCTGGTCTNDCTLTGDCPNYDCAVAGCDCSFSCTADSTRCNGECKAGTTCSVDCGGASKCHPKCKPGAICDFDCTGVKDCKRAKCEGDAQCLLNCTDTMGMDCKWDVCDGGEMSCPGDILACGRDCPL
jgi:hypothetical protein